MPRRRFETFYLGDGAYVRADEGGDVELTTTDGVTVTNRIVLEPAVLIEFERWVTRARREAAYERSTEELRAEEPT